MNPIGVFKAGKTPAQASGAQSEVQTRSSSPYGVLARSNNTQLMGNITTAKTKASKNLSQYGEPQSAPEAKAPMPTSLRAKAARTGG